MIKLLLLIPLFLGGCTVESDKTWVPDGIFITFYVEGRDSTTIKTDSMWHDGVNQYVNDVVNQQVYTFPLEDFEGIYLP